MIITLWKDSKILHPVRTTITSEIETINRSVKAKILNVKCPADIVQYQQHMCGVDGGDKHRVMGVEFTIIAHFKNSYKKAFMGVADVIVMQAFAAYNLLVDK